MMVVGVADSVTAVGLSVRVWLVGGVGATTTVTLKVRLSSSPEPPVLSPSAAV